MQAVGTYWSCLPSKEIFGRVRSAFYILELEQLNSGQGVRTIWLPTPVLSLLNTVLDTGCTPILQFATLYILVSEKHLDISFKVSSNNNFS